MNKRQKAKIQQAFKELYDGIAQVVRQEMAAGQKKRISHARRVRHCQNTRRRK